MGNILLVIDGFGVCACGADCDLFIGANDALSLLDHKIVPGTVILFDELINYNRWKENEVCQSNTTHSGPKLSGEHASPVLLHMDRQSMPHKQRQHADSNCSLVLRAVPETSNVYTNVLAQWLPVHKYIRLFRILMNALPSASI